MLSCKYNHRGVLTERLLSSIVLQLLRRSGTTEAELNSGMLRAGLYANVTESAMILINRILKLILVTEVTCDCYKVWGA